MATIFKLKNVKAFQKELRRINKEYNRAVKETMAIFMTRTRIAAAEHIIPNTTGTLNPYRARKSQASVSGRLTERTGKLKYMLLHNTGGDALSRWQKLDSILSKEESIALKGQIRTVKVSKTRNSFVGTYRVHITMNGRLSSIGNKRIGFMPKETTQTLGLRFKWETGIRGQKRPIFEPVVNLREIDFRNLARAKINAIRRL